MTFTTTAAILGLGTLATSLPAAAAGPHWPAFRGANASGVADPDAPAAPTSWDVATGENIRWKVPVPGLGLSSPVIWGDRVFLTTAVSGAGEHSLKVGVYGSIDPVEDASAHRFLVLCYDRRSGDLLWSRTAHSAVPQVKRHPKASHANCTAATDGDVVVAFFGSEGLFCYNLGGELRWKKNLGLLDAGYFRAPAAQWGFGSSPIIHDGVVIVQCDVQGDDFIAAYDLENGAEVWRTPRDDVPTWGTPVLYRVGDQTQVVANGWRQIGAYDAADGKPLWSFAGGGDIPVASPVVGGGLVFITNAHGRQAPVYAVRARPGAAAGEPAHEIVWQKRKEGAYLQTPLYYRGLLYVSKYGVLRCFDARTGEMHYQVRLMGGGTNSGFTPSPVASGGVIYFTGEHGDVVLVEAGPEFKVRARLKLGENCMATPAISEGAIYFRTQGHLVAVGGG